MPANYSLRQAGDILEITFSGEMRENDLMDLRAGILRLSQDRPRSILVDMSGTPADAYIPTNLRDYFAGLPYRRYAIYGGIPSTVYQTKLLVDLSPDSQNLRFFRSEQDARAWLAEESE